MYVMYALYVCMYVCMYVQYVCMYVVQYVYMFEFNLRVCMNTLMSGGPIG